MGKEDYVKLDMLGQGTFGIVHKARHKETGQIVAIKKLRMGSSKDGVEFTALREIKLLQELNDPNVLRLHEVYANNNNISLVMDYCVTDVDKIIKDTSVILRPGDIKRLMHDALSGVAYLHDHWVLHRDIKPENILVSPDGHAKLADFGLARVYGSPDQRLSDRVVTRWYRAPELLFGSNAYGPGVDMWAMGCVFAELMLRVPLLPGDSDIHQLTVIFQALGTPTEADWPHMSALPKFFDVGAFPKPPLESIFKAASPDALDLLARMFVFDPAGRISAREALSHPYFTTGAALTPHESVPLPSAAAAKRAADAPRAAAPLTMPTERAVLDSLRTKLF